MRIKNLSSNELNIIAQFLLEGCSSGTPALCRIKEAAAKFGVERNAVSKIWSRVKQQKLSGMPVHLSNKKSEVPHKKFNVFDKEKLLSISVKERGTYRSIETKMEASKSIVGRWVKEGLIRPHTNSIKPALIDQHKLARLKFSLKALEVIHDEKVIRFKNMSHIVHVDEKWFFLTKTTERYYLAPDEEESYRTCQSKKFITKVMFLCAVCRSVYNLNGECIFDGKIGIFPFTERVPAQRTSKNMTAGTIETKAIDIVNKDVINDMFINQVIPTIKSKWPIEASRNIVIQQDNVRPHIDDNDPEFRHAASSNGFNIHIENQPPKSPDTNINDLGWFRALQSLHSALAARTIDDLLGAVHKSFDELTHIKLNAVFLTLQSCYREIILCGGFDKYKIPHMGKDALLRAGNLPTDLEIEKDLVITDLESLITRNEEDGLENLITAIKEL